MILFSFFESSSWNWIAFWNKELKEIISCRIEEIIQLVKKDLDKNTYGSHLFNNIIIKDIYYDTLKVIKPFIGTGKMLELNSLDKECLLNILFDGRIS